MISSIDQVTSANTVNTTGQQAQEMGQEDFLKLLVAQLKNQDPNNPADNGEFLGQIAQFSMVSGIDDLGASFDGVANSLYSTQAMEASSLVGKDVLAETNVGYLSEGESIDGVLTLAENVDVASGANLKVHDASGELVRTLSLSNVSEGSNNFNWDGLDDEGNQMPEGAYFIHAEALVDESVDAVPIQIYNEVDSVSVDRANTTVLLNLETEESITLSSVSQYK